MTKRDRENVVGRLRDGKPACLMLAVQGGGLSEGMDYEGNILSAIAVVGLPLAPPNLEVRALIGHFASVFGGERGNLYGYIAPALNRVVQSAGRLIRSEKDRGVVVLMDERFAQARYAALLPPEMRPEMLGSPDELIAEVKRFFAMR
jgi:DNA excision repair protein ERCC-2